MCRVSMTIVLSRSSLREHHCCRDIVTLVTLVTVLVPGDGDMLKWSVGSLDSHTSVHSPAVAALGRDC